MLRRIRTDLDPVLRQRSREVKEVDDHVRRLLDDMAETMRHAKGIGLAAPQIGLLRRVVVTDIGEGLLELINPEILSIKDELVGVEGCLSLPGQKYQVSRALQIVVKALDRQGREFELTADQLLARVIQHELDHLDGILINSRGIPLEAKVDEH